MILRIISGGQTGADVAGLWSAKLFGLSTGGWAPKRYLTLDGLHPEMAETFGIKEHPKSGYRDRTITNLIASDITLVCSEKLSPGTTLTLNQCKKEKIIHYLVKLDPADLEKSLDNFNTDWTIDQVYQLIKLHKMLGWKHPFTINIAGNSTRNSPRSFEFTFKFCHKLFTQLGYSSDVAASDWKIYQDKWR